MSDAELEAIRARDAIWPARYGRKTDPARDRRILLARLDAAEARLAEVREALGDHYPQASTYPDDTPWLTCSCGWDQDDSTLKAWPEHILAALAEPTEGGS